MGKWTVTPEEVRAKAQTIQEHAGEYKIEWSKIYEEVQSLKGKEWDGVANQAFNVKIEGYRPNFENMTKLLNDFAELLDTAAKNYIGTEDRVTDAANQLPQ